MFYSNLAKHPHCYTFLFPYLFLNLCLKRNQVTRYKLFLIIYLSSEQKHRMIAVNESCIRDFPTFLKSGQGPVEFGEKKHLDHQIATAILNGLKTIQEISSVKL